VLNKVPKNTKKLPVKFKLNKLCHDTSRVSESRSYFYLFYVNYTIFPIFYKILNVFDVKIKHPQPVQIFLSGKSPRQPCSRVSAKWIRFVNFVREMTQNLGSTVQVLADVRGFFSTIFDIKLFRVCIGGEEARDDGQVPGVQGAEREGVPGVLRQEDCAQVPTVFRKRGICLVLP
jgi:hypothetical protein